MWRLKNKTNEQRGKKKQTKKKTQKTHQTLNYRELVVARGEAGEGWVK